MAFATMTCWHRMAPKSGSSTAHTGEALNAMKEPWQGNPAVAWSCSCCSIGTTNLCYCWLASAPLKPQPPPCPAGSVTLVSWAGWQLWRTAAWPKQPEQEAKERDGQSCLSLPHWPMCQHFAVPSCLPNAARSARRHLQVGGDRELLPLLQAALCPAAPQAAGPACRAGRAGRRCPAAGRLPRHARGGAAQPGGQSQQPAAVRLGVSPFPRASTMPHTPQMRQNGAAEGVSECARLLPAGTPHLCPHARAEAMLPGILQHLCTRTHIHTHACMHAAPHSQQQASASAYRCSRCCPRCCSAWRLRTLSSSSGSRRWPAWCAGAATTRTSCCCATVGGGAAGGALQAGRAALRRACRCRRAVPPAEGRVGVGVVWA